MNNASAVKNGGPFEEQRRIYELLSQETRHLVLQYVLAHPAHLPSLDELAYLMPKNRAAIRDQLQVLADANILKRYEYPPNEESRDLPSQFYGLTEYGVEVLSEYNYLRGLPIARALYDNTRLSEKAQRHQDAPRPTLPEAVSQALTINDSNESANFERLERYIRERKSNAHSVDDQIVVAKAFYTADIGPDHEGLKRTELLEQLDIDIEYQAKTVLDHLVEIELLDETTPPGPDVFAISERLDEIVNGRVTDEAKANIEALISHIDDELQSVELDDEAAEMQSPRVATTVPSVALADGAGRTIGSIISAEFDIAPERVTNCLRSGDPIDRLNAAVEAIESSEEVSKSEDYGQIVFLNQAYRYRLTEHARNLLQ
jgi:predicted ArsR family transcriptional regulator